MADQNDQKQGNSDDITSGTGTGSDLVPPSKVSKSSSTTDLVNKKVYTCQHNHHHHRHKHHHHYHHHMHHNKGQCFRKTKAHKSSQTKSGGQIYRVSKRNTKTIISAMEDDDDDEDPDAIQYTSRDLCVPKRDL